MRKMILLTLLILVAMPLKAEQVETLPVTSEAFLERLDDGSVWHLAQLNAETYPYTAETSVFTLTDGRFILPTPCGTHTVPLSPQQDDLTDQNRAIAQPCIAIHVTTYDVISIMSGSDTAKLAGDGSLTFQNDRGLVILAPVPER